MLNAVLKSQFISLWVVWGRDVNGEYRSWLRVGVQGLISKLEWKFEIESSRSWFLISKLRNHQRIVIESDLNNYEDSNDSKYILQGP